MSEYYNPEVQQLYPDTCAIKSQQLILKDFGIDVSETELVQAANANGWYNGGGTSPEYLCQNNPMQMYLTWSMNEHRDTKSLLALMLMNYGTIQALTKNCQIGSMMFLGSKEAIMH